MIFGEHFSCVTAILFAYFILGSFNRQSSAQNLGGSSDTSTEGSTSSDYEYEYEDNTEETTVKLVDTSQKDDLLLDSKNADVQNALEDETAVTTDRNSKNGDELDTFMNPPSIFSDFRGNEQTESNRNDNGFKETFKDDFKQKLPKNQFAIELESDDFLNISKREDGDSKTTKKGSTAKDHDTKKSKSTVTTSTVKTPLLKLSNILGGQLLSNKIGKLNRTRPIVSTRRPHTTTPVPTIYNETIPPIRIQEGSDYFVSHGIEDIAIESRKSEASMLEKYNRKDFYLDCQEYKGCFGGPEFNCTLRKSCEMAISYQPKTAAGGVLIELTGRTSKYIALGLSTDTKMGEDNVIECVRDNDQVRIYRSFNKVQRNIRLADHSGVSNLVGHYADGWLYCSFILKKKTTIKINTQKKVTFDLEKNRFYLLLARGNTVEHRAAQVGIGYHDLGSFVTPQKYNLMVFGDSKLRRLFERLHGICILIDWILLLPISTFVIRYFKNSCHDQFLGNLSIWFAAHVILNGIAVGLTISAMVLIIIKTGFASGSGGWTHHSIAGLIFCACVLIQTALGIRIYSRRHNPNKIISRIHAIFGHINFLLSYSIIFKSMDIRRGLPCASYPILVVWIVLYFLIHLILSYQVCYIDFVQGLDSSRVYRFTGLAPSPVTDADPEPAGSSIRKALLGILILISLLATGTVLGLFVADFPDCIRQAENE